MSNFRMRRRYLIVGNWKMNGLIEIARELAIDIGEGLSDREANMGSEEVVICPPYTALYAVNQSLGTSVLKLGAQDMAVEEPGAFTGDVSGVMLKNVGCRFVILGHSERRTLRGEDDALVARKVAAAYRDGLQPIVCLGETLEEREQGITNAVVTRQLAAILSALPSEPARRGQLILAYEPVWAIGTGRNASPHQAQEVHGLLRKQLKEKLGDEVAKQVRILYGGSMKPDNASDLLSQPDVDGGLIGGASLKAQDFLAIIDALPSRH